jgi:hypothetical protein
MATPDSRHSIVIKKSGTYRGITKIWANRYHFEGDLPPDNAHWATFADAIVTAEKAGTSPDAMIIEAVGYDSSSATSTNPHGIAVFTKTYTTAGTLVPGTGVSETPGDCAVMVRYATPARSSKNHPVYLFNYYHGVFNQNSSADLLAASQKTAYQTYADHWVSGFSDGAENHERCGPHGAVALSAVVDQYVRHRDFKN